MAVDIGVVQEVLALVERIAGQQATAQQQQQLVGLLTTLLDQGNSILNREIRAVQLLDELRSRVAANQTQSATNALTIAQTSNAIRRQIAGLPTSGENAQSVWQYNVGLTEPTLLYLLYAGQYAGSAGTVVGVPVQGQPFLRAAVSFPTNIAQIEFAKPYAPLDPKTILATDATPAAWVQRQYATYGWQPWLAPTSTIYYPDQAAAFVSWVLSIEQYEFDRLKEQYLGLPTNTPPVWPGINNVTLGSTVNIAPPGQTVTGPLDGVIVQITAVPVPVGYYAFNGDKSFVKIGGVAFQTDNGYDEEAQPVSFEHHIITPRRQVRAAAALFRWLTGVQGTITPWTIT